jgi:hypothetical protein
LEGRLMPEPIKCPRCKEGDIYERSISYAYSRVVRRPDGEIDYGMPEGGEWGDVDCWTCLDCGAIVGDEEKAKIENGGDA